jgi:hypothetical protein
MNEIRWMRGFCQGAACGRYIGHFGDVACPQCDAPWPSQARYGIVASGIDLWFGQILGLLTCSRWNPSRLLERVLYATFGVRPRDAEELLSAGLAVVAVVVAEVSASGWSLSHPALLLAFILASIWRIVEILMIRMRIVLYDRRSSVWRHGSYTRTILLISISSVEVVADFAVLLVPVLRSAPDCGGASPLGTLIASAGVFIGREPPFGCPGNAWLNSLRITEAFVAFALLALAFSAVVNMLASSAKEADQKSVGEWSDTKPS